MANDRTAPGGMGMLLLALLEGRDMYGYEMIEALRARSNEVFRLKAGTLYPLLHSLEAQGWVTSSDGVANGRTRRYYALHIMTFTAFTGAVSHVAIGGGLDVFALTVCVVVTLLGARIAAVFANRASAKALNRVTGVVLTILGAVMVVVNLLS